VLLDSSVQATPSNVAPSRQANEPDTASPAYPSPNSVGYDHARGNGNGSDSDSGSDSGSASGASSASSHQLPDSVRFLPDGFQRGTIVSFDQTRDTDTDTSAGAEMEIRMRMPKLTVGIFGSWCTGTTGRGGLPSPAFSDEGGSLI
jgi:hypothetical protein